MVQSVRYSEFTEVHKPTHQRSAIVVARSCTFVSVGGWWLATEAPEWPWKDWTGHNLPTHIQRICSQTHHFWAMQSCFLTCMRLILPSEKLGMIVTVSFSARNSISLASITGTIPRSYGEETTPTFRNPWITEIIFEYTEEFWVCCRRERRCFSSSRVLL